jgi:hypothetical protein
VGLPEGLAAGVGLVPAGGLAEGVLGAPVPVAVGTAGEGAGTSSPPPGVHPAATASSSEQVARQARVHMHPAYDHCGDGGGRASARVPPPSHRKTIAKR